jgi:predicted RNase H-like HicB family nuclease
MRFTAIFRYIGFVEELPGANTQGKTLREARTNLKEAVKLVLEANRELDSEPKDVSNFDIIRESSDAASAQLRIRVETDRRAVSENHRRAGAIV